jgi:hypothetical protein
VLRPGGLEQAVEVELRALGAEHGVDLVARQRGPDREEVVVHDAGAVLTHRKAADVEGVQVLALHLDALDVRAFARHEFGDCGGECGGAGHQADVGLDDGRLAARTGEDEVAQVAGRRRRGFGADVEEVDGLLDDLVGGQVDETAILEERGVERGERVVAGVPGEVRLQVLAGVDDGMRQGLDELVLEAVQVWHVVAVDEDELDGAGDAVGRDLGLGDVARRLGDGVERQGRQFADRRVLPRFLLGRREAGSCERCDGRLARLADEPVAFLRPPAGLELVEVGLLDGRNDLGQRLGHSPLRSTDDTDSTDGRICAICAICGWSVVGLTPSPGRSRTSPARGRAPCRRT